MLVLVTNYICDRIFSRESEGTGGGKGVLMRLFVIVGMPAAGKNIARTYGESRDIPYFATGDVVREEVRRRGLEPNGENTAIVSSEMRGDDGLGVTRHALKEAMQTDRGIAFLEGMRSWPEIELIRQATECTVIAFIAPRQVRRDRMQSRGRSDDTPGAFDERDKREIDYGAAIPIALADAYILNTGTMDEAFDTMDGIVRDEMAQNPRE